MLLRGVQARRRRFRRRATAQQRFRVLTIECSCRHYGGLRHATSKNCHPIEAHSRLSSSGGYHAQVEMCTNCSHRGYGSLGVHPTTGVSISQSHHRSPGLLMQPPYAASLGLLGAHVLGRLVQLLAVVSRAARSRSQTVQLQGPGAQGGRAPSTSLAVSCLRPAPVVTC